MHLGQMLGDEPQCEQFLRFPQAEVPLRRRLLLLRTSAKTTVRVA